MHRRVVEPQRIVEVAACVRLARLLVLVLVGWWVCCCGPLVAQTPVDGEVSGSVVGHDGRAVAGARVVLRAVADGSVVAGVECEVSTAIDGSFVALRCGGGGVWVGGVGCGARDGYAASDGGVGRDE